MLRQESKTTHDAKESQLPKISGQEVKAILDNYETRKPFYLPYSKTMKQLKIFFDNPSIKNEMQQLTLPTLMELFTLLSKKPLVKNSRTHKSLKPLINKFTDLGFQAILKYFSHQSWLINTSNKIDLNEVTNDLTILSKQPQFANNVVEGFLILKKLIDTYTPATLSRKIIREHPQAALTIANGIKRLVNANSFSYEVILTLAKKYPHDIEKIATQIQYVHLKLYELKHGGIGFDISMKNTMIAMYINTKDVRPYLDELYDNMPYSLTKEGKPPSEEIYSFIAKVLEKAQKEYLFKKINSPKLKLFDDEKKCPGFTPSANQQLASPIRLEI